MSHTPERAITGQPRKTHFFYSPFFLSHLTFIKLIFNLGAVFFKKVPDTKNRHFLKANILFKHKF